MRVVICALQASEHLHREMLWGDARKQHSSEWVGHPVSLGALGRERKPDSSSFLRCGPKMPLPEQDMLLFTSWLPMWL